MPFQIGYANEVTFFASNKLPLSDLFQGRKFNKNGELTAQWWSRNSLDGFSAKAKCVENQYSMYKVRDKYPVSDIRVLKAVVTLLISF